MTGPGDHGIGFPVTSLLAVLDRCRALNNRYSFRNMRFSMCLALTAIIPDSVSTDQFGNKVLLASNLRCIDEPVDALNTDAITGIPYAKTSGDLFRRPLHPQMPFDVVADQCILQPGSLAGLVLPLLGFGLGTTCAIHAIDWRFVPGYLTRDRALVSSESSGYLTEGYPLCIKSCYRVTLFLR